MYNLYMPKKKTKAKSKKTSGFLSKLDKANSTLMKPKVLLAVIVLIIAGFFAVRFVVNTYQASQEKKDFLAKHQELERIADKIAAQNKPDERVVDQSCRYASAKFEKGDLSCLTNIDLTYENYTFEKANEVMKKTVSLTGLTLTESGYPSSGFEEFSNSKERSNRNSFHSNLNIKGYNCSVFYSYLDSRYNNTNNLIISLSCLKSPAKAEHFPLKK